MDPATMAAIGTALGFAKSEFIDKPNENKDRRMASITARYSPWTGMKPQDVESTNTLGAMASMGVQGAAMGQSMEQHDSDQALKKLLAQKLSSEIATPEEQGEVSENTSGDERQFQDVVKLLRASQANRALFK